MYSRHLFSYTSWLRFLSLSFVPRCWNNLHQRQKATNIMFVSLTKWNFTLRKTNRFHVAVRLFSNRSQMTSKCGNNKKSGTRGDSRVCHWCTYHILTSSLIYFWTDAPQHGIYLFYIITKQTTIDKAFFYFRIFPHNSKAGLCLLWRTRRKPFDVIYCLSKMKQSHWLLCAAKNCDWSRKITPLSNLTRASLLELASRGMKTYSKSRIELRNLQILKKMLKSQVGFCHQSGPVSRKAWTLPWILQELKSRETYGQTRGLI